VVILVKPADPDADADVAAAAAHAQQQAGGQQERAYCAFDGCHDGTLGGNGIELTAHRPACHACAQNALAARVQVGLPSR
jgi:hypothetical protein